MDRDEEYFQRISREERNTIQIISKSIQDALQNCPTISETKPRISLKKSWKSILNYLCGFELSRNVFRSLPIESAKFEWIKFTFDFYRECLCLNYTKSCLASEQSYHDLLPSSSCFNSNITIHLVIFQRHYFKWLVLSINCGLHHIYFWFQM